MSAIQTQTSSHRQLTAVLPDWCALRWQQAVLCGLFVLMFVYFCLLPVSSVNTWHDIVAGQMGRSPSADNFTRLVPLSEGVRHFEIGWAGCALIAMINDASGSELLSLSFAVVQTCSLISFSLVFFQLTGRWWSAIGVGLLVIASIAHFDGIHGQSLGYLLFSCLVLTTVSARSVEGENLNWASAALWRWAAALVIFAVWANTDASFVLGLAWLATMALARLLIAVKQFGLSFHCDREFRNRVWLAELALVATAINPNGIALWKSFFWWPDNPWIQSVAPWAPPAIVSWNGMVLVIGWAVWIWASRTNRELPMFWVLIAVGASIGVACSESFFIWFPPLMMMSILGIAGLAPHRSKPEVSLRSESILTPSSIKFGYTLVAGLLIWLGFCLSPAYTMVGGTPRTARQLAGHRLPFDAMVHLTGARSKGLAFSPSYWSDWLHAHTGAPMFAAADPSLVTASVLADYRRIYDGESNWHQILDKYEIDCLIIDKIHQSRLVKNIRRDSNLWKIVHEDDLSLILEWN